MRRCAPHGCSLQAVRLFNECLTKQLRHEKRYIPDARYGGSGHIALQQDLRARVHTRLCEDIFPSGLFYPLNSAAF